MRPWLKWTLIALATLVLAWAAVGGIAAYYVFRHLETRDATEPQTRADFEAIRARFGSRPPLIEITDPLSGDVRVNRLQGPGGKPVDTVHVLTWNVNDQEFLKTEVPLWLLRFNTVAMISKFGLAPEKFRVTVDDIKQYGPGIVVDYGPPGSSRVLIWVD